MNTFLLEAVKTPVVRLMAGMSKFVLLSNSLEYVTGVSASFQLNLCAQEKPNWLLLLISSKSCLSFQTSIEIVAVPT